MTTSFPDPTQPIPGPLGALRILLVDDNPADSLINTAALKRADSAVQVRAVVNLEDAFSALGEERPDAIILDLSLPDSDGIETFLAMHRRAPGVPVVVLSGLDNDDTIIDIVHNGAQDFLVKGDLREGELLRAVRLAIARNPISQETVSATRLAEDMPLLPLLPVSPAVGNVTISDGGDMATVTSSFALTEGLGRGGTADVILAQQVGLDRQVAVKILREEHRRARSELMFQTEARVMAKLEHPNIVPVYDVGRYFIVMRRVQGITLSEALADEAATDLSVLIEALIKVCDAVEFAHSRGVIHRDIKPDNIMLGHHGEVFLVDWGLALSIPTDSGEKAIAPLVPEDAAQVCAGTPAYLAPEIARGDHQAVGCATDVFLLGGTLYAILSGRAPYHMVAVSKGLAVAAGGLFRPLVELAPTAPLALRDISRQAMAVKPADRPTVQAFRLALRAWLLGS